MAYYLNLLRAQKTFTSNYNYFNNVGIVGSNQLTLQDSTNLKTSSIYQAANDLQIYNSVNSGIINFSSRTSGGVLVEPLKVSATSCEFATNINQNGGKTLNMYSVTGQTSLLRLWNIGNTNYTQLYQNSNIGVIDNQTTLGTAGTIQMFVKDTLGTSISTFSTQVGSTQISGNGTSYNFFLSANDAFTGQQVLFIGESGINYIQSAPSNTVGSSAPLRFTSRNATDTFAQIDSTGVSVPTKNFYGRNDAFGFTTIPSGASTQPIGFSTQVTFVITVAATGNVTPTINLDAGVWVITGTWQIIRGSGTFNTGSYMAITTIAGTGYTFYPTFGNAGFRFPIASTATLSTINANFSNTIVVTTTGRTVSPQFHYEVGLATIGTAVSTLYVGYTKVA